MKNFRKLYGCSRSKRLRHVVKKRILQASRQPVRHSAPPRGAGGEASLQMKLKSSPLSFGKGAGGWVKELVKIKWLRTGCINQSVCNSSSLLTAGEGWEAGCKNFCPHGCLQSACAPRDAETISANFMATCKTCNCTT